MDVADFADLDSVELHGSLHDQTGGILHIAMQIGLRFEKFPAAARQEPGKYQHDRRGNHEKEEDSRYRDRRRLDLDV